MPLTEYERAEIRRQNGSKSRGPTTDEGKRRSRWNALKHGFRAEVLPLPDEDPDALRDRHDAWHDFYRPNSPAAFHLVDQCVRATLLADRCDAYHRAALAHQIRTAELQWDNDRADEVERHKAMLVDDPATAVRLLRRSGLGCRWMIGRWEELGRIFEARGFWHPDERAEVIRLRGEHPEPLRTPATAAPALRALVGLPEPERGRYPAEAFAIHMASLACQPDPPVAEVRRLTEAGRVPYEVNGGVPPATFPPRDDCRATLLRLVADALAELRPLAARLGTDFDGPDRSESRSRASLMMGNPTEARLFLRYHAESRTSFFRAFKELTRALKADESLPAEPLSPEDRDAVRRRTMEILMRNTCWPNGDTMTLEEAWRAVGIPLPDEPDPGSATSPNEPEPAAFEISPNEPEPGVEISPNEPEPGVASVSPNEPEAAVAAGSPNEPEAVAAAVSPNEPEVTAEISPNEPEAVAGREAETSEEYRLTVDRVRALLGAAGGGVAVPGADGPGDDGPEDAWRSYERRLTAVVERMLEWGDGFRGEGGPWGAVVDGSAG